MSAALLLQIHLNILPTELTLTDTEALHLTLSEMNLRLWRHRCHQLAAF